ncbi:MAG TPA: hypothetical protein VLN73_09780, partial [Alphaproteobacteria bacterium]|nr:hypothetical protein [Alphaproteobacteria bacterium]
LCTARNIGSRPARNTLSLKAAWCLGNRVDSWVDATVSGANSVNDPAFRDLVDETVAHLFPPHMDAETIRDDDGDDRPM